MNKVKAAIISIIAVLVIAGVGIGCYCLWPAVNATIQGEKYYTQKDVQDSYDNGYYDGCKNGEELTGQVDYYKKLVDEYYINVNTLNGEIATLNAQKMDYERRVESLTELKTQNEQTIADLQDTVKTNNNTINELNTQITILQREISSLETTGENNAQQIELLQNQVATLQSLSAQLQTTNAMNVETITSLNNQVANLNNQISEMSNLTQSSSSQILALNNKINELQKSVDYYETYIAQLESGERVVATFEFNGSVYDIQIVNKDSKLTVTDPVNTELVIFNGWTVDGELVDLSVYTITQNTKFVADVSYLHEVKFMVDDEVFATKYAADDATVSLSEMPTKDGYDFDGWSINGVDIVENIETIAVTENTVYVAVFTKLHTVTFMVDDQVVATQKVRNGCYAQFNESLGNEFAGWLLNGEIVNLSEYEITGSVVLVAKILEVLTFTDSGLTNAPSIFYGKIQGHNFFVENNRVCDYDLLTDSIIDFGELDISPCASTDGYFVEYNNTYYCFSISHDYNGNFICYKYNFDDEKWQRIDYLSGKVFLYRIVFDGDYLYIPSLSYRFNFAIEGLERYKFSLPNSLGSVYYNGQNTYYVYDDDIGVFDNENKKFNVCDFSQYIGYIDKYVICDKWFFICTYIDSEYKNYRIDLETFVVEEIILEGSDGINYNYKNIRSFKSIDDCLFINGYQFTCKIITSKVA